MEGYRGLITAVDAAQAKARAQLPDMDQIETDWLPVAQTWTHAARSFALPRIGQQAFVFFLDQDLQDGLILAGRYSDKDKAPPDLAPEDLYFRLEDGTRIQIAKGNGPLGAVIEIETPGAVIVKASKNIEAHTKADLIATAAGDLIASVKGDAVLDIGGNLQADAGGAIMATAGSSATIEAASDIQAEAGGNLTAKAGAAVTIEAAATATIKASAITLDGPVTITGPVTAAATITAAGPIAAPAIAASGGGAVTAGSIQSSGSIAASGAIQAPTATFATDATIAGVSFKDHKHAANGAAPPS